MVETKANRKKEELKVELTESDWEQISGGKKSPFQLTLRSAGQMQHREAGRKAKGFRKMKKNAESHK